MSGLSRGYNYFRIVGPLTYKDFMSIELDPNFWSECMDNLMESTQKRLDQIELLRRFEKREPMTAEDIAKLPDAIRDNTHLFITEESVGNGTAEAGNE